MTCVVIPTSYTLVDRKEAGFARRDSPFFFLRCAAAAPRSCRRPTTHALLACRSVGRMHGFAITHTHTPAPGRGGICHLNEATNFKSSNLQTSKDLDLSDDAAVGHRDLLLGAVAGARGERLDLAHDVHAVGHLAEDDVAAVQPGGGDRAQELYFVFCFWFLCLRKREVSERSEAERASFSSKNNPKRAPNRAPKRPPERPQSPQSPREQHEHHHPQQPIKINQSK
jgi:hypothetical protein